MPRRERSVLHAAETYAVRGDAYNAIGWFYGAGMVPPRDWLLSIVTAFGGWPVMPNEFYGYAIREAARCHDNAGLREIADHTEHVDHRSAALANKIADGSFDALKEVERAMQTTRLELNLRWVLLPSAADFTAPPPAIPPPCNVEEINHVIFQSYEHPPDHALELLLTAACAYPLIYAGSNFLRYEGRDAAWAWRYFEAAEHLRDLGLARDI